MLPFDVFLATILVLAYNQALEPPKSTSFGIGKSSLIQLGWC